VLATDERYWSAGLFNFYLHNVPINVYIVTYLLYRQSDQTAQIFLYYILVIQLFAIAMSMVPAASASFLLHSSRKYLCSMQAKLTGRHLWLKLKYATFHEQVATNNIICYHVGPFFSINKRTCFDVSRSIEINFY